MKRLSVVAVVVVAVAVCAAIYIYRLRTPSLTLSPEELRLSNISPYYSGLRHTTPNPASSRPRWMFDGGGRTGRKGALNVSFSLYTADDGVVVEQVVESYGSTAKARQRLNELVAHALRVVERSIQLPSQARKDRVYLVAHLRGQRVTVIAWTDGSKLYMLRCPSAPHALEFERLVYGPKSR